MHFQWYPGHMTKAKRMMQEDIKLIDVVIELVDARIPKSSKNPDMDEIAKNKSRIILLNKFDLADPVKTQIWKQWYEKQGFLCALVNSKKGTGVKTVHAVIEEACKAKTERDLKRGIQNRPIRAMIVGIPNVGKSTFINTFVGKALTKTGNRPGITKGKQWIRVNKRVELLDTPGILWPKFDDQKVGLHLAWIGSIKDEILNMTELSLTLIEFLKENYNKRLEEFYQIEPAKTATDSLSLIAVKRGCLKKGNELDYEKAALLFMDDFKAGKIGAFTLELPD